MIYPATVKNFEVYGPKGALIGTADIALPKIQFQEDTIKGSGVGGEVKVPIQGNVMPMETTISFHANTVQSLDCFVPGSIPIRAQSDILYIDAQAGVYDEEPEEIMMTCWASEYDLQKREVASKGTISMKFAVTYLALVWGNVKYWEIDPMSNICIINGQDANLQTRANLR